jgi:hypothetical protein
VRQLAAAFKRIPEKLAHRAAYKSSNKLPHSEGALLAQCSLLIFSQPKSVRSLLKAEG